MSEIAGNSVKSRVAKKPSLRKLYNNIMKDLENVEEELRLFSHSPNKLISDISTYLFQTNGKRIIIL